MAHIPNALSATKDKPMKNILIISGHPDLKTSVANAAILDHVSRELPQAEIRLLDTLYPTTASTSKPNSPRCLKPTSSCSSFRFHGTPCPA
jgi:hypothetical protein